MSLNKRFENFKNKSSVKFKDLFDFSNLDYINAKTRIDIKCKKHNFIFKQTPDKHLQSTHACPKCLEENKKEPIFRKGKEPKPHSVYTERLRNKFNTDVVIISGEGRSSGVKFECPKHGIQFEKLDNLLQKSKKYICIHCATEYRTINKLHSVEKILKELKEKHPLYTFDIPEAYKNKRTLINIKCDRNHNFRLSVQKLMAGRKCPHCNLENLINENRLPGGYCEKVFKINKELKDLDGCIYWMKVGEFFKIGISRISAKSRLKSIKYGCACEVTILHEIKMNLYKAYQIEQLFLNEFKQFRIYSDFSTELFSKDLTEEFLKKF